MPDCGLSGDEPDFQTANDSAEVLESYKQVKIRHPSTGALYRRIEKLEEEKEKVATFLVEIRDYPAGQDSEPEVMGAALFTLNQIAREALATVEGRP